MYYIIIRIVSEVEVLCTLTFTCDELYMYLCKLVVIIGLVSLMLQCLCHACLCLQGNLALIPVCLGHLLLLTVFMILRRKVKRGEK